jgi:hypothetical protein
LFHECREADQEALDVGPDERGDPEEGGDPTERIIAVGLDQGRRIPGRRIPGRLYQGRRDQGRRDQGRRDRGRRDRGGIQEGSPGQRTNQHPPGRDGRSLDARLTGRGGSCDVHRAEAFREGDPDKQRAAVRSGRARSALLST